MSDEPVRFDLHLKPGALDAYSREQVLASPVRWSLGGDVLMTGMVQDFWLEDDGKITLIVEGL
ncbi:hypothetical protein AB0M54_15070 [Actinoplanes sp. NPDC051470]|uniref:hypothetical protein n=1 Tax=unclassified Actinoplanes TaxID=2626549 RepID=UPI003444D2B1